jgi:hypothetical protein
LIGAVSTLSYSAPLPFARPGAAQLGIEVTFWQNEKEGCRASGPDVLPNGAAGVSGGNCMNQQFRKRRWLRSAIIVGGFLTIGLIACVQWYSPILDGHPHRLKGWPREDFSGMVEADFVAIYGYPGKLIEGSRAPGTSYKVEWSDDTRWNVVSFGPDGEWEGISRGSFFTPSTMYIHSPTERFLLWLRTWGVDVR